MTLFMGNDFAGGTTNPNCSDPVSRTRIKPCLKFDISATI